MPDTRPVCEHCGSLFCLLASPDRCRHTRRPRSFVVEPPPVEALDAPAIADSTEAGLSAMTRKEIDEYAAERGMDTTGARTKAEAIALIEGNHEPQG